MAARNNTKETEHEIETNVNIELVILSCFKKTLTTNKSLKEKNYFAYSLLNALLSINLVVMLLFLIWYLCVTIALKAIAYTDVLLTFYHFTLNSM